MWLTCHYFQVARLPVNSPAIHFGEARRLHWKVQSVKQPGSTRRQQSPEPRRRQKAAVELRRGDLAYRPPPWHLTYDTIAARLHTPDMIKACSNCEVHIALDVAQVGAGYFVSGFASADLPLQCDCCLATFNHPLAAPFKVWLDASLDADEVSEDPCQLPFPSDMQAIDLGPAVNDAIMIALLSANLCGHPDCSIRFAEVGGPGQTTGWSANPQAQQSKKQVQPDSSKSGQFAALQKLKSKSIT